MFLVFEGTPKGNDKLMAININSYDLISITKGSDKRWTLRLELKEENREHIGEPLITSKNYNECEKMFKDLIESIAAGKKVFKIPKK